MDIIRSTRIESSLSKMSSSNNRGLWPVARRKNSYCANRRAMVKVFICPWDAVCFADIPERVKAMSSR